MTIKFKVAQEVIEKGFDGSDYIRVKGKHTKIINVKLNLILILISFNYKMSI